MKAPMVTGRSVAAMLREVSPPPCIHQEGLATAPIWIEQGGSFFGTIPWAEALDEVARSRLLVTSPDEWADRSPQFAATRSLLDDLRGSQPQLDALLVPVWDGLGRLTEVEQVIADLLKPDPFGRRAGVAEASRVVEAAAALDAGLLTLMMEPNMALHLAEFLRFIETVPDPRPLSLRELPDVRRRFIDALGMTTVFRAELYDEGRLREIRSDGLSCNYLRAGGSIRRLAALVQEYGVPRVIRKAILVEGMPTCPEPSLAAERLLLSVSVGDREGCDGANGLEVAESIARSVATAFVRMKLLDEEGLLESGLPRTRIIERARECFRNHRIMVIKARVPKFFLYRQVGLGESVIGTGPWGASRHPGKMIEVRLPDGRWICLDQANDPDVEGLIEQIDACEIESIVLHPLDSEAGFLDRRSLDDDLDEHGRLRLALTSGYNPDSREPVFCAGRQESGEPIRQSVETPRTVNYRDERFAAFSSLSPPSRMGARRLAMMLADLYKPDSLGTREGNRTGQEVPTPDELREMLRNNGLSAKDAEQVLLFMDFSRPIAGGYAMRPLERTLPIDSNRHSLRPGTAAGSGVQNR